MIIPVLVRNGKSDFVFLSQLITLQQKQLRGYQDFTLHLHSESASDQVQSKWHFTGQGSKTLLSKATKTILALDDDREMF